MPILCPNDQTQNPESSLHCSACQTPLSRLTIGERFLDRFLVKELLRSGETSFTYLVDDSKRLSLCVLREFLPSDPSDRSLLLEFDRIAKLLIHIHPAPLVRIIERFTKDRRFFW